MTALGKMTILTAKRLEGVALMHLKGRIQVGCDADITLDPDRIIEANFEDASRARKLTPRSGQRGFRADESLPWQPPDRGYPVGVRVRD